MKQKKFDDHIQILIEKEAKEEAEKLLNSKGMSISDFVREQIHKLIKK